ncbi:MAG TPA: hypothetical protein VGA36_10220 [Nitriliruptorales bacterium]
MSEANVGDRVVDARGRVIGRVDAVYADYLLVRTRGLLPVDLYVPRSEVNRIDERRLQVALTSAQAYEAWHRPLRRAPHD